jgi:hypothetical protein
MVEVRSEGGAEICAAELGEVISLIAQLMEILWERRVPNNGEKLIQSRSFGSEGDRWCLRPPMLGFQSDPGV